MRKLLLLTLLSIATFLNAQTIKTTVTDKFSVKKYSYSPDIAHTFAFGDSVTIYAYKKKSDKYYFLVDAGDYVDLISCKKIPFDALEKQLKKLPNALDDESRVLKQKLQNEMVNRKRGIMKKKALAGEIWTSVASSYSFTPFSGTDYKLQSGDIVYVIGYKVEASSYYYALYSDNFAGIYKTSSNKYIFSKEIDTQYLPSVNDPDVQNLLADKQKVFIQREAEAKVQYRNKALKGEVIGILSFATPEPIDDNSSKYKSGDTVRVVGYSKVGDMNYYALYSDYNYGTFRSSSLRSSTFKNSSQIYFDRLPAYDDPEVKLTIKNQSVIIDSVWKIRLEESKIRLAESQAKLINMYKQNKPFIINNISWDSNSVGGIEVSLSITNCTNQTIKYVTFQGFFKNAVGDRCHNEIGGGTIWKGRGVGPIGPCPTTNDNCEERMYDCKASYDFDNLTFYSRVANTFKLSTVTVEYTNGRKISLSGANLDKHVIY